MVLLSSISTSGGIYPAALWCGVTMAIFLPIDLIFSYSSSSITALFSDGEIPGPISGAPKS